MLRTAHLLMAFSLGMSLVANTFAQIACADHCEAAKQKKSGCCTNTPEKHSCDCKLSAGEPAIQTPQVTVPVPAFDFVLPSNSFEVPSMVPSQFLTWNYLYRPPPLVIPGTVGLRAPPY